MIDIFLYNKKREKRKNLSQTGAAWKSAAVDIEDVENSWPLKSSLGLAQQASLPATSLPYLRARKGK